jgi:hypothetical protein
VPAGGTKNATLEEGIGVKDEFMPTDFRFFAGSSVLVAGASTHQNFKRKGEGTARGS